jgi:hypothetical protein
MIAFEITFLALHTHSFLPERNGIVPNTLHVCFHVAVSIVLALFMRDRFISL